MFISPVKIWRNQGQVRSLIGQSGRIVSFTVIRIPPVGFALMAPYPVAIVQLENRRKIMAQLVDFTPEDIFIGRRVRTVIRKVREATGEGIIPYGVKVKPI